MEALPYDDALRDDMVQHPSERGRGGSGIRELGMLPSTSVSF